MERVWGERGKRKSTKLCIKHVCVCKHNVYQLSVVTAQVPSVPCGDNTSIILCCCSIVIFMN